MQHAADGFPDAAGYARDVRFHAPGQHSARDGSEAVSISLYRPASAGFCAMARNKWPPTQFEN